MEVRNMIYLDQITSVSGTFHTDDNKLTAIQFGYKSDADGQATSSPCFGAGDCTAFTLSQPTENDYLAGLAGKTNSEGHFVELTALWASVGKFCEQ